MAEVPAPFPAAAQPFEEPPPVFAGDDNGDFQQPMAELGLSSLRPATSPNQTGSATFHPSCQLLST